MTISVTEINNFIEQQIKKGAIKNKSQAEQEIASKIAEMSLDRCLEKGEDDIEQGRYSIVNKEWISGYITKLEKKLRSAKK